MSVVLHEQLRWQQELTENFIKCRIKKAHLFSGKRHSATRAWSEVIKELKLEGMITTVQCKKKWENMVRKYKDICELPDEERKLKAKQWPSFDLMDSLYGHEEPDQIIIFESCSMPATTATPPSPSTPSRARGTPRPSSSASLPPSPEPRFLDSPPANSLSSDTSDMDPCSSVHCQEHRCNTSKKRVVEEEVFHEIKRVCSLLERSIKVHEKQGERFLALFQKLVDKNTR